MSAKAKGILHVIVNLGGNGMIFELVPVDYRPVVFLVFNLLGIVYAYLDPTYTFQKLGKTTS